MARQQKTPIDTDSGKDIFDAFAITKNAVPEGLMARGQENRATAPTAPRPKRKAKPTAESGPADEKPIIRRMGRRRTGRNVPFSQAVTAETANNFYAMQAELGIPMGAVLELAIKALMDQRKKEGEGN